MTLPAKVVDTIAAMEAQQTQMRLELLESVRAELQGNTGFDPSLKSASTAAALVAKAALTAAAATAAPLAVGAGCTCSNGGTARPSCAAT